MGTTQLMSVPYALHAPNKFWQDLGNGDISTNSSITGNIGIGTGSNPIRGRLEVSGNQQCCGTTQGDIWQYLYNVPNGQFQYYNGTDNFDISVYADGRFMALVFISFQMSVLKIQWA